MCDKCKKNNCGCDKIEFCGCKTHVDLLCSKYTGATLEKLDIKTGTDGNTIIKIINDYLEETENTDPIIVESVGLGAEVFKGIADDYKYEFKSIVQGDGILITEQEDTITVSIDPIFITNLVQQYLDSN